MNDLAEGEGLMSYWFVQDGKLHNANVRLPNSANVKQLKIAADILVHDAINTRKQNSATRTNRHSATV